jgi:hypothetical protein
MKNVILVNRLEGMSRDAYREHYEKVHAPLGAKYFHFHKYVRSHVVESETDDVEFDCYGEFWPAASAEQTAEVLKGPVAQIMIDDRALFMSTRRTGGNVEEVLLAGAPRGIDPPRARREILLLRRRAAASRDDYDAALREIAEKLVVARRAKRVILDRPVAGGPGLGNIQADGILQIWPTGTEPVLRGLSHPTFESFGWVAAESYETPPEQLHASFGGVPPA